MSSKIAFNTNLPEPIRTRADFTYNITPAMISITDRPGQMPGDRGYRGGLAQDRAWYQGSIAKFKIMCRDGKGFWDRIRRDGKTVSLLALQQTDSARSLQEVVYQRELIGREVRPIQKRKLCSLHDGSIVDLAHSPGEYCDRCVGDRVHK